MVHGLGCSAACGIFQDQGSNPCLPHWQVDSLPLSHQGSPLILIKLGVPSVGDSRGLAMGLSELAFAGMSQDTLKGSCVSGSQRF